MPLFVRTQNGNNESVQPPVSTLDVVATIEEVTGRSNSDGTSLFNASDDRRVFSQARGENEHSQLRRHAVRTREDVCFCERDRENDDIEFGDDSDQSLRSELEAHVEKRVNIENGDNASEDGDVDEEIERRLSALGYKD